MASIDRLDYIAFQRKGASKKGFTLIEILCVLSIMAVMGTVSFFSINTVVSARLLSNNAYELASVIRQARTAAITQNTYVGVGFYPFKKDGNSRLMVATVFAKSGLKTDLQNNNFQLLNKLVVLKNVQFDGSDYLSIAGIDASNNSDLSQSEYSAFNMTVPGDSGAVEFSNVIVISPSGEISLKQDGITRCLGIGLNGTQPSSQKQKIAAVQVAGLSGQISVFEE